MSEGSYDLRFLHDDRLRSILLRDAQEMDACLQSKAHKASVVLAGSIIEAVILDHFLANPSSWTGTKKPEESELGPLLIAAGKKGVMSERALSLSSVVRNYRNLLHPGKELRSQEAPDHDSAVIARTLVNIVIKDVLATYQKQGNTTAQDAFEKMEQDPMGTSVISLLLAQMSSLEREVFLKEIPERCYHIAEEGGATQDPRIAWLESAHKLTCQHVPDALLTRQVAALQTVLSKETPFRLNNALRFWKDELRRASPDLRRALLERAIELALEDGMERKHWAEGCEFYFVGRYIDATTEDLFRHYINSFEFDRTLTPIEHKILWQMCGTLDRKIAQAISTDMVSDWNDCAAKETIMEALAEFPF